MKIRKNAEEGISDKEKREIPILMLNIAPIIARYKSRLSKKDFTFN